jgi:hypothetical protein
MRHSRSLVSLIFLFLFLCMAGTALAAASYDHTEPNRGTDADIERSIKVCLEDKDPMKARLIAVYSFRGHVFMVGEQPFPGFGLWAERVAHYEKDTHFVTAHWFPAKTADPDADPALKSAVISQLSPLMRAPNRVEVEVLGQNVVLLGIVRTPDEIVQAERLARAVRGVKPLRSHIMTSEQALKAIGNPSELYQK